MHGWAAGRPMMLPHYSYLLAGLIPRAQVKIYPDSAHGFLFQHHAEFAADVEAFLGDPQLDTQCRLGPDNPAARLRDRESATTPTTPTTAGALHGQAGASRP
jgi:hypothetical protein